MSARWLSSGKRRTWSPLKIPQPGASGEPLFLDIRSHFYGKEDAPIIIGGRYGLGSKNTTPSQIMSVYENLERNEPKADFTIGIIDEVTSNASREQSAT